jgi:hypothetical protein
MFGGFGEYDEFEDYSSDYSSGDEFAVPASAPDMSFNDSFSDDSFSDDSFGDDSFGDDSGQSAEVAAWDRCYEEPVAADATACFQQYVDSGEIDATVIPVALRFPECGYADVTWRGDLYSMSDADFVATVEAARPCFLALVDAGTLVQFELPNEIAHLECFEGRNWYNTFDDAEYDTRYYDCLAAANDA